MQAIIPANQTSILVETRVLGKGGERMATVLLHNRFGALVGRDSIGGTRSERVRAACTTSLDIPRGYRYARAVRPECLCAVVLTARRTHTAMESRMSIVDIVRVGGVSPLF